MGKQQPDATVKKSIRKRIVEGYLKIILLSALLGVVMIVSLSVLFTFYGSMTTLDAERAELSNTIYSHYQWREGLINSLENNTSFEGSLDPATCSFGKWLNNYLETGSSEEIRSMAPAGLRKS